MSTAVHLMGAENILITFGTRTVLESVTTGINAGQRIGIVGRNGDGKSTLMRILTGQIEPDEGRVTMRGGLRVGALTQSDSLNPEDTVGTSIVGDRPEYEWASDAGIRSVITGLVADLDWDAPVSTLSGGQRRRVSLAKLLVEDWDVIALDEPTNHLDLEGIHWLADHLKSRWQPGEGALMVITHDRWFLDEVATDTWEVHDGIVEPFEGGYAAYVLQRVERDRIRAATEQKRQNLMRKELAWLRRGAPARTSKPKFRVEAANELIADVPEIRNPIELKRLAVARLGKDVVDLENVSLAYDDGREVLRNVTFRIGPGDRIGILGPNGAGKSTLLGLISGQLEPTQGTVKRGKTVQIGFLDQQFSQLEEIGRDPVREVLSRTKTTFNVDGKDLTPAQLLERLGFAREHLSTYVSELSGGQKRRLQLLLLLLSEPNVIILDEPTNDVDSEMLAAMEDLLDSWPATLIVVSHDRYLLERVTDMQYAILDGTVRHLPGGVDEYLRVSSQQDGAATASSSRTTVSAPSEDTQPTISGAERRAMEKEMSAAERKMTKLNDQVAELTEQMEAHDPTDFEGLQELSEKVGAVRDEIDQLEERWLEISEIIG